MNSSSCDVLVVGGGPAGLAAAIALRRQGMDVVVAEALSPPIDKACGEGLMPDSRAELQQLGIELDARKGHEFTGIHFANRNHGREDCVTAEFSTGKGIGVRRVELHSRMIERAVEVGVRLKWGARVGLRDRHTVWVDGEACRYRYLIGADGEASRLRRWAGLDEGSVRSRRFGFRRHYRVAPWSSHVEVHWGAAGQAYVTPVGEGEICVAAITSRSGIFMNGILDGLPHLREKLSGHEIGSRDRGAVTTTRKLRRVVSENVALVGDASGSVDAITGEGMAMAFRQAILLGESLRRDRLEDYQAAHDGILKLPQRMATAMLAMDRWDWLRDRAMHVLARDPRLFARLLAVHVGEERFYSFALQEGLGMGWNLLIQGAVDA